MTGDGSVQTESALGESGGLLDSVLLRDRVVGEAGGLHFAVAASKEGADTGDAGSSTGDGGDIERPDALRQGTRPFHASPLCSIRLPTTDSGVDAGVTCTYRVWRRSLNSKDVRSQALMVS